MLRGAVALVGGLAKPLHGFAEILRNAPAVAVKPADVVLGAAVALLGGLLEPVHRLVVVARNPHSVAVEDANGILSGPVPEIGSLAIPFHCPVVTPGNAGRAAPTGRAEFEHSADLALLGRLAPQTERLRVIAAILGRKAFPQQFAGGGRRGFVRRRLRLGWAGLLGFLRERGDGECDRGQKDKRK